MLGKDLIKSNLVFAPELPGVYSMFNSSDEVIYIGKAKNLKNRLFQYTQILTGKNKLMVEMASRVEFYVTETESEALLLEGQLIKKFKPKFNILLKDDKSFPYIKLRTDHDYPQLIKFRGRSFENGKFFGPFASSSYVDTTLLELQKIFRLRSCSDNYFSTRVRPCIQYQIKRCCAPCVGKISKDHYDELVKQTTAFLTGNNIELQNMLTSEMEQYSRELNYEKAAEVRDRIKAISYVQLRSQHSVDIENADFIAIVFDKGVFCIQVFLYRNFQACGSHSYFPSHTDEDTSIQEVLGNFIIQYYHNKTPPLSIYISHEIQDQEIYASALGSLHNKKVKIIYPKARAKKKILDNLIQNAKLTLAKNLINFTKNRNALAKIKEIFDLPDLPSRIEVYDNSHIQGGFPVGAMVVSGADGFIKNEYRLFNIKEAGNIGDDYAMLKEVMTRRVARLKSAPQNKPDLMIIDGGKGHMGVVSEVLNNANISIPFVCMSKGKDRNSGREFFHMLNRQAFTMDKNDDVMKYLQILRDEVHNFAITSHRKKRSKAIKVTSLDQIPYIGASRKKSLLNYFGSVKAIADATVSDLQKVNGISKEIAQNIYKFFRDKE